LGDTAVAIVHVTNRGTAPASFLHHCVPLVGVQVVNASPEWPDCVAGCMAVCSDPPRYVEDILAPQDSLSRTFVFQASESSGFRAGSYVVSGGVSEPWGQYPWATAQLLVAETDLDATCRMARPNPMLQPAAPPNGQR